MSQRKGWLPLAVVAYLLVASVAASYLAGALYFVTNKAKPQGVTLSTWWDYWHWYGAVKAQRKKLQIAAFGSVLIVYVIPFLIFHAATSKRRSLHGDARFAHANEIRGAGLFGKKGIIVGKHQNQYLVLDGQLSALLIAPTRSGKGVAEVIPNLLNFDDSAVVLDIKLENFKLTSKFRAEHSQKVYLFSPFSEDGKTHSWNPFDRVRRDPNLMVGDVQAIAQVLYPSDGGKDTFWNDQARNLFQGLALLLLETPELTCSLGEILRQSSGKGRPIKDYLQDAIAERQQGSNPFSNACVDALNRFCQTSDNTLASIVATFNAPLLIFANPIVDAATCKSDFDIAMVRKQRMTIYVGISPNRLPDAAVLLNLFFSQLINANTDELPQINPALKHQCLLILDEFTAMGRVGIIAKSVSYFSGYNLRLLTILQSLAQMEDHALYGEKGTRTITTNHALQIVFPPREQKDANEYSEILGYFTEQAKSKGVTSTRGWHGGGSTSENTSDQRRALMLPQELKELGQDKQIVVFENCKPVLCEKAVYYNDPVFIDRLKSVSPTLRALGQRLPDKDELEHVAFVLEELSAPVPVLDLELHRLKLEQRVRPLQAGEQIDLSKLAINTDSLPELDDPANPSEESVSRLADAFFSQLGWVSADDEATGTPVASSISSNAPSRPAIDLSVLELC